jgi:hypothetical protein
MKISIFLILLSLFTSNVFAADPVITADKRNATISVYYPDTNKTITQPALFGKVKSDVLNMDNYNRSVPFNNITPAGTFKIEKIMSWHLNEPMLVFIRGKSSVGAIHPLWMKNPKQERVKRLNGNDPNQRRITGGCINVDSNFFYNVLNNVPEGTTLTILPE